MDFKLKRSEKILITCLNKNLTSILPVKQTSKLSIFLVMTINLSTGKYRPYNKPDNDLLYIDVNSNHPPNITKNLPDSTSKQIDKLSSDKFQHNVFIEEKKKKKQQKA